MKITQGSLICGDEICPLKHTKVTAKISGILSQVKVTHEFKNPYKKKIDTVYTFPLSADSAVHTMKIKIGKRTIVSKIKTKEEARKIFEKVRRQGYTSSLLEQDRPNMFTQKLANILPKQTIVVEIHYFEIIKYDKEYEFVFPMTITPQFNTQKTIPYTKRSGHDVSIKVELIGEISEVKSKLHDINLTKNNKVVVELKEKNTIPNKDFILRFKAPSDTLFFADDKHFMAIIQPPELIRKVIRKELIFVIDDSGSMSGWPIEKAKDAMKYFIKHLNPKDTFQMISFSNDVIKLFDGSRQANNKNISEALLFLSNRTGKGVTRMAPAVLESLTTTVKKDRIRIVCFMTDGAIGNEFETLEVIKNNIGNSRFFSFGIGNAPNRFLLDRMADLGRGEVSYLSTEETDYEKRFYSMVQNPLLSDIKIDFNGGYEIYPTKIKDLFSSRPVIICGKYKNKGKLTITGKPGYKKTYKPDFKRADISHYWAREKIKHLMHKNPLNRQHYIDDNTKDEIIETSLKYRIISQYTSFVAVEKKTKGESVEVQIPLEIPDGFAQHDVGCTRFFRLRKWECRRSNIAMRTPIKQYLLELNKLAYELKLKTSIRDEAQKIIHNKLLQKNHCFVPAAIALAAKNLKKKINIEKLCKISNITKTKLKDEMQRM